MRRLFAAAALLAATSLLAAPRPPHARSRPGRPKLPEDRKTRLANVVAKLRANADRWVNDQEIDVTAELSLKGIFFTKPWVPHLAKVLDATTVDANGLYVANRLLRQLSFAPRETIRAALPTVKGLHARAKKTYQSLPRLTEQQVKALKEPTNKSRNAREALAERRAKKLEKEKPIAKHNLMVYVLERRTFQLMLLAQNTEQDGALCESLVDAEKTQSALFLTILEGLAADARKMSQQRAEGIYAELRPFGLERKMEKKKAYFNRGKVELRDDDASTYERTQVYPGLAILKCLNRIATAARMPALKVPKEKDIVKYHRDLAKKRDAARKQRDRRDRRR